jgi:hypothetical protein
MLGARRRDITDEEAAMHGGHLDHLARRARGRRALLGAVVGSGLAGLMGMVGSQQASGHDPRPACRLLPKRRQRATCLRRARRHLAAHRSARLPNAACRVQPTAFFAPAPVVRIAQTFTEPNGGRLLAAQLLLNNGPATTGTYLLQLNTVEAATGEPTNTTLAASALPVSEVGDTPAFVTFPFPTPVRLVAGQQYALVLSRPGGGEPEHQLHYQEPGTCPGGEVFTNTSPTGRFSRHPTQDLPYVTVVRP